VPQFDDDFLASINDRFSASSLRRRLEYIRDIVPGKIVLTTSLGAEDQLLTHYIFVNNIDIDVVTLDTGRLFPETYDVWERTEDKYERRITAFFPDATEVENFVSKRGINGFRSSVEARQECCKIRKVIPLNRALGEATAWIAGLRAEQSSHRASIAFAEIDPVRNLLKVNPIADWTLSQIHECIYTHGIPYNALHDQGFPSIGCQPCTRAVHLGENDRAGRWWWEHSTKECGLHIVASPTVAKENT
jgi:phosphoadenosine phosphosulfate reductase